MKNVGNVENKAISVLKCISCFKPKYCLSFWITILVHLQFSKTLIWGIFASPRLDTVKLEITYSKKNTFLKNVLRWTTNMHWQRKSTYFDRNHKFWHWLCEKELSWGLHENFFIPRVDFFINWGGRELCSSWTVSRSSDGKCCRRKGSLFQYFQ